MQNHKIIVLGDSGSGKTSLVTRYITGEFDQTLCGGTIGVDYHSVSNKTSRVQIWDTAGQERFRALTKIHYRGTDAALVIFDMHNPDADNSMLEVWIEELVRYATTANKKLHIVIIGNKSDLTKRSNVSIERLKTKYPQIAGYHQTSAKTGKNVKHAFDSTIAQLQEETLVDVPITEKKPEPDYESLHNARVQLSKPLVQSSSCC